MSTSTTKRIQYIDALRGFTMFLVVYQHINAFMGGVAPYDSTWSEALTAFRMPLFFFISGYIAYKVLDWTPKTYFQLLFKKAKIQLIPTVIFSLIFTSAFYSQTKIYATEYWFTFVLFEFFLIYYTISFLTQKHNNLKFILLLLLAGIGVMCLSFNIGRQDCSIYDLLCLENVFKYFQFFVLGLIAKRYESITTKALNNTYINGIAIVVFVISLILLTNPSVLGIPIITKTIRSLILRYSGLFIVLSLFYRHREYFAANGRISRTMQYVGRHTLDIYMLHYFFINFGGSLAGKIHEIGYLPLEVFAIGSLALMNIALCLLLSQCIRNSNFLAKYLFGAKVSTK